MWSGNGATEQDHYFTQWTQETYSAEWILHLVIRAVETLPLF
jgi:hypothetical protein